MSRISTIARLAAAALLVACSAEVPTTVATGGAVTFNIVSGDNQAGYPGMELPAPVVVMAMNGAGKPVKGQLVNFVVTEGGGTVFAGSSITNEKGIAQDYWTLGCCERQTLEVRAVDPTTGTKFTYAKFTATLPPEFMQKRKKLP